MRSRQHWTNLVLAAAAMLAACSASAPESHGEGTSWKGQQEDNGQDLGLEGMDAEGAGGPQWAVTPSESQASQILILGSDRDRVLLNRVAHACELLKPSTDGSVATGSTVERIVLSGGQKFTTDHATEAEKMAKLLTTYYVDKDESELLACYPKESGGLKASMSKMSQCVDFVRDRMKAKALRIFMENTSTNTQQNYCYTHNKSDPYGKPLLDPQKPLYVVSTHFHARSVAGCFSNADKFSLVHPYYRCDTNAKDNYYDDVADYGTLPFYTADFSKGNGNVSKFACSLRTSKFTDAQKCDHSCTPGKETLASAESQDTQELGNRDTQGSDGQDPYVPNRSEASSSSEAASQCATTGTPNGNLDCTNDYTNIFASCSKTSYCSGKGAAVVEWTLEDADAWAPPSGASH